MGHKHKVNMGMVGRRLGGRQFKGIVSLLYLFLFIKMMYLKPYIIKNFSYYYTLIDAHFTYLSNLTSQNPYELEIIILFILHKKE